jgi:hypothetical protein
VDVVAVIRRNIGGMQHFPGTGVDDVAHHAACATAPMGDNEVAGEVRTLPRRLRQAGAEHARLRVVAPAHGGNGTA